MKLTLTIKDLRTLVINEQATVTYCPNTTGAPDSVVLRIPKFGIERDMPASHLLWLFFEDEIELDIPHEIPV